MRYFSALWARMYRFSANSRATISSTAIFLSQQSRQYFSSPRGSETSFAPHSAHRDLTTAFLGMTLNLQFTTYNVQSEPARARGTSSCGAPRAPVRRDEELLYADARVCDRMGARRRQRLSDLGRRQRRAAP